MGFKEYCNDNDTERNKDNSKIAEEKVEDLYNKYKDKNEDELLFELLKNVELQKKEGKFNYEALVKIIEKMSPFLSDEQRIRIKEILKKIQ